MCEDLPVHMCERSQEIDSRFYHDLRVIKESGVTEVSSLVTCQSTSGTIHEQSISVHCAVAEGRYRIFVRFPGRASETVGLSVGVSRRKQTREG